MTIQGFLLLHKMKKVQQMPQFSVCVDTFCNTIETAGQNLNGRKEIHLSGNYWDRHFVLALEDLSADGYIVLRSGDLSGHLEYQVTSRGQYLWQHLIAGTLRFLAKSIVTPIAVSILTTFVTLKLFGQI